MATMKAVRMQAYGGPDVLVYEDVPRPDIAADEVLVRVHAAAVNPMDWKVREGHFKELIHHQIPLILGWDVCGEIESLGSGVTDLGIGDTVYAMVDNAKRNGAYAEYVALPAATVAAKPVSLDPIRAASVPLTAHTAWQGLFDTADLSKGQCVLVHGAAGNVGSFAVQFAKLKGAYVIGTASADAKEYLFALGADEVIDYKSSQFENRVCDVDVVLDTIGGDVQERSWKVLKQGGTLVATTSPPPAQTAAAHGVQGKMVNVRPSKALLTEIARLIDSGQIKTNVGTVFELAEVRQAHELSQHGHSRGKIVLQVGADLPARHQEQSK